MICTDSIWLLLYNLFLAVLSPVFLLLKLNRHRKRTEETYEIERGRLFYPSTLAGINVQKTPVVLVALGWGEVSMMARLTQELESRDSQLQVIWCLRDPAACRMVRERYPQRPVVLMPFDFGPAVAGWWRLVRPRAVIVLEKFWWPNLVWYSRLHGAKLVLVNGRSRGRSSSRYKLLTAYQRWILRAFDLLLFSDEEQVRRVRDVLPAGRTVLASGNIKFTISVPQVQPGQSELEDWIAARATGRDGQPLPLLVAGSTHGIDEEWLFQVFSSWTGPEHCLLMAPRALYRCDSVVEKWEAAGFAVSRRSRPVPGARILLLDTMGELPFVYRDAVAAHVGGAVSGRGHNILEPLMWGVPVSYGPNRGDFEHVQKAAEAYDVGVQLTSPEDLKAFWHRAFEDEMWRSAVPGRAREMIAANASAIDTTVDALLQLISEPVQTS